MSTAYRVELLDEVLGELEILRLNARSPKWDNAEAQRHVVDGIDLSIKHLEKFKERERRSNEIQPVQSLKISRGRMPI